MLHLTRHVHWLKALSKVHESTHPDVSFHHFFEHFSCVFHFFHFFHFFIFFQFFLFFFFCLSHTPSTLPQHYICCFQSSLVVVDSVCTDVTRHSMFIYVRTAHRRCQAQIVAQDTEQKHGKHGSGAPLSSFPLLSLLWCSLSTVVACPQLRIWSEREARPTRV